MEEQFLVTLGCSATKLQALWDAYSPELTLDLDPARAAQEGPGLVPLLHGGQTGAEHLQPQV